MNRLRAMFTVVALTVVGGVTFTLAVLKPGLRAADAMDAGILQVTVPMQLQCKVRIRDACRRPDGGAYPKYATVKMKARKWTSDAGDRALLLDVPDLPDGGGSCILPVGTFREACTVLENGACTDATVCCANCEPQGVQDACACRAANTCRLVADGGVAPLGVTLSAGSWTGAGCVRKYCGPEIAGEQGQSWPAACP